MIHYHGGPITPDVVAVDVWTGGHAMVSWGAPEQIELAAEVSQSFCVDNSAFKLWFNKQKADWPAYYGFVQHWRQHPAFDFALIPDVIDGSEEDNDELIDEWPHGCYGVPVWHLHESLNRLKRLCAQWPRVALGSSGEWSTPGTENWWKRMVQVMDAACESDGTTKTKLHGLRMMNPEIFTKMPFASVDSTNVARNIGLDKRWNGSYAPPTKRARAAVLVSRIEAFNSPAKWNREEVINGRALFGWANQQMLGFGSEGLAGDGETEAIPQV